MNRVLVNHPPPHNSHSNGPRSRDTRSRCHGPEPATRSDALISIGRDRRRPLRIRMPKFSRNHRLWSVQAS